MSPTQPSRPADHQSDASQPLTVDVVVIGAGPAGENAAQYAVEGTGLTGVLIEAELVGGECSYWACMPSKALLRPLDVLAAASHLQGLTEPELDPAGLLARRDVWRSHLDDAGQVSWAESAGLSVLRGRAALSGVRRVAVESVEGTRIVHARHAVVLATGSVPTIPEALASIRPWTSRDATGVLDVPERLAVVGGGVVACEASTWMSALGSKVTMLVRGDRLLPKAEPFASEAVLAGLRGRGVEVRFGAHVNGATRADTASEFEIGRLHGGPVSLAVNDGELTVDEVLAATGRRPAISGIGLESVDLSPSDLSGGVDLGNGWLYAVGDVTGGPPLTHWGKYQARLVGELIAARASGTPVEAPRLDAPVTQVVFTDPQVALVGFTAAEASDQGRQVRLVDQPMTSAAGFGLLRDDASGTARLVIEEDVIVGATFVGPDVAELLHAATIAIAARTPLATLRHAVPAYPTASEVWLRLVEAAVRPAQ